MVSLTSNVTYDGLRQAGKHTFTLKDATTFFQGQFVCINSSGRLAPYTAAAGDLFMGRLAKCSNPGFKSDTTPYLGLGDDSQSPKPTGTVEFDDTILPNLTIGGLAGTLADIRKLLYMTDDHTFTVTRPSTKAVIVGEVLGWAPGTTPTTASADALIYGFSKLSIINTIGTKRREYIGSYDVTQAANATARAQINLWGHGKIVNFYGNMDDAAGGGGGKAIALNLAIMPAGGVITNLTGGVITVLGTAAAGSLQAGTAITGANEYHDGDTLQLVAVGAAPPTGTGRIDLYVDVIDLPGA